MRDTYFHLDPGIRKELKDGVIPTKYLKPDLEGNTPVRSTSAIEKRTIIVKEQINIPQKPKRSYSNFNDIVSKLKIMRLDGCSMEFLSSEVTLKKWMKAIFYQNYNYLSTRILPSPFACVGEFYQILISFTKIVEGLSIS